MERLDPIYRVRTLETLRRDLVELVERNLTPIAMKYGYATTPLEDKIKWRPMVLLLGNYSSGKSTLINELLGVDIQKTGQAPTDDSFTVISSKDADDPWDERDGMALLNDPRYPFTQLKKQGQRFASHFRLKQVDAPILDNLALIDTPGMLDSVTEKDRGYNYQEVIAELASIADLILIMFDPHKAGTVRETYESLRSTLPRATYEDRIIFVLNRIDECAHLNDLLRVYGTLCWNLSQMTGRKDIPDIYLTHSVREGISSSPRPAFLDLLKNQRLDLKAAILKAPQYRLDHLATFIEAQGERMGHFLEALEEYGKKRRRLALKSMLIGLILALIIGGISFWYLQTSGYQEQFGPEFLASLGALIAGGILAIWLLLMSPLILQRYHKTALRTPQQLTRLDRQNRRESWENVESHVASFLQERKGRFSLRAVHKDCKTVKKICAQGAQEARRGGASIDLTDLGELRV